MTSRLAKKEKNTSVNRYIITWTTIAFLGALILAIREFTAVTFTPPVFARGVTVDLFNAIAALFVDNFKPLFEVVGWLLEWPLGGLRSLLQWLPWSSTVAAITAIAYFSSNTRLAVFTSLSLLYMIVTGYWAASMNTLALVGIAVPLAVGIGFGIGILGYKSNRANRIILPCLDLMQTVPTFAYLIPILLLFGFGPVVGLVASILYAVPPMVRNVVLGLKRVPREIIESGYMCGTTALQRFWQVEVKTASPQIMVGVNQTIMASLSMVIIASIIGGSDDIGWEVLSTMRKAQFGQSLLAGMVIVLIAMILDRISGSFATQKVVARPTHQIVAKRRNIILKLTGIVGATLILSTLFPFLWVYPQEWSIYPANTINTALQSMITMYGNDLDRLKNAANYYFLLPIKIGLHRSIALYSWGTEFSWFMQYSFWLIVCFLSGLSLYKQMHSLAVLSVVCGTFLFFGMSGIPWPLFFAIAAVVAWYAGGFKTTLFAILGMSYILITGVWAETMLSIYLCGAAVLICGLVGGSIGILAASNDKVSAFVRPINDTLQTIPQFVYLIPILMVFQVGDLSAMLAIIAYSIVPIIRYTEHGIRNVPPNVIEAATAIGSTKRNILFQIQLPIALPEILLGLNQTILYGLGMLVIAALVGTQGLGQLVYIALGKADAGLGLVAGLSIALVAMVSDRIVQAWAHKRKKQLGLI